MPETGPPQPKPWPAGAAKTDADRLTVPRSWELYSGVLGYHLPRHLNNAGRLSDALRLVR